MPTSKRGRETETTQTPSFCSLLSLLHVCLSDVRRDARCREWHYVEMREARRGGGGAGKPKRQRRMTSHGTPPKNKTRGVTLMCNNTVRSAAGAEQVCCSALPALVSHRRRSSLPPLLSFCLFRCCCFRIYVCIKRGCAGAVWGCVAAYFSHAHTRKKIYI
jgi:hypothetical protein